MNNFALLFRNLIYGCCLIPIAALSQHPEEVSGQYELPLNDALSIMQLKEELVIKAKAAALQNKFGTSVMKMESAASSEMKGIKPEDNFWSVTETRSRGTWLCDRNKPVFSYYTDSDGKDYLKVTVTGYARELKEMAMQVHASVLSCPEPECEALLFHENSAIHIFFRAATAGYLQVFAEDLNEGLVYGIGTRQTVMTFAVEPGIPVLYPDPLSPSYYYDMQLSMPEGEPMTQQLFRFVFSEKKPGLIQWLFNKGPCSSEVFRDWLLKEVFSDDLITVETVAVTVLK